MASFRFAQSHFSSKCDSFGPVWTLHRSGVHTYTQTCIYIFISFFVFFLIFTYNFTLLQDCRHSLPGRSSVSVSDEEASISRGLICAYSRIVAICTFGVSSALTHFPAAAVLHFQTVSFGKSDICKWWRMQWPVPETIHLIRHCAQASLSRNSHGNMTSHQLCGWGTE